ncbi:MAG: hypothetical protein QG556_115, partial [Pseudomonadota bacterium]|nr:hypothetical protein [Pseudomonadota bacterium]
MKFFIINLSRDGFTMALAVVPGRELAHERAFKEKMTDLGLIEDKHYSKSKYCVYTYEVNGTNLRNFSKYNHMVVLNASQIVFNIDFPKK